MYFPVPPTTSTLPLRVSLIKMEGDSKGYIFLIGHTGHKFSYHSAFPRCPSLHQSLRLSRPWEASGGRVFAATGPGPARSDGDRSVARSFCKKVKSIYYLTTPLLQDDSGQDASEMVSCVSSRSPATHTPSVTRSSSLSRLESDFPLFNSPLFALL